MIPLGDSVPNTRRPTGTILLVVACVLVFLYELSLRGQALDLFVERWGATPRLVLGALAATPRVPRTELLTLFTSEFLHAGWLHLGGNMVFLWVFGRGVEDRLGTPLYLVFYLLAGALAGLAECLVEGAASTIPQIGASGAIAAVLGAYLVSYPKAWVTILAPVLFFFWTFDLPAILVLAFWFVTQLFNGVAAITQASHSTSGNIAVWAHVAGFLVGMVTAPFMPRAPAARHALSGSAGVRQASVPGPARLVSSVANLLALLLAARFALDLTGLAQPRTPLAPLVGPVFAVTNPIVLPFAEFFPRMRVGGFGLEVYTLVAIVAVYVVAALLTHLIVRR